MAEACSSTCPSTSRRPPGPVRGPRLHRQRHLRRRRTGATGHRACHHLRGQLRSRLLLGRRDGGRAVLRRPLALRDARHVRPAVRSRARARRVVPDHLGPGVVGVHRPARRAHADPHLLDDGRGAQRPGDGGRVCLWAALLGLGATGSTPRSASRTLAAGRPTLSVVLLAGLRTLGPLWVLLILACVVALRGPRALLAVAGRHRVPGRGRVPARRGDQRRGARCGTAATPRSRPEPSTGTSTPAGARRCAGRPGSGQHRRVPLPQPVGTARGPPAGADRAADAARCRRAPRRAPGRWAVVLAAALCLAVPSVLVAITLEERGGMWQGRYSLPFTAGVMMLAGLVLDRVRWRDP